MSDFSNLPTLKPLAFTKTQGVSYSPKAVFRSGELWVYCLAMQETQSSIKAEDLYQQYLVDADVVIIDDSTLNIERLSKDDVANWEQEIINNNYSNVTEETVWTPEKLKSFVDNQFLQYLNKNINNPISNDE